MVSHAGNAIVANNLEHAYHKKAVLNSISLSIPMGSLTAVVGPDGVGKSTLLGLIAGVRKLQTGSLRILGADYSDRLARQRIQTHIAYMPQGLGRNLYPSLSIRENLEYFAAISGVTTSDKQHRIEYLVISTGLQPFMEREAGKLSGGMKQKLALCAALITNPNLIILDEPTTGVDPLSRRQFWELVNALKCSNPSMTVLVSTAYMEEAERFEHIIAMENGRILAQGKTAEIVRQTGTTKLEDAYVVLKKSQNATVAPVFVVPPFKTSNEPPVIVAENLTMQFGDFKAVDNVSFTIERGEIFGFIGSNGCGKSTTMKMLTGLLPATSGHATLLGQPIKGGEERNRRNIGYMSQSFTLYQELSVKSNLVLHARLYQIPEKEIAARVETALNDFDLRSHDNDSPAQLPLGIRQRLQLAAACLHQPEILILDEPTSGVDPDARNLFWRQIINLSRGQGVTIFISTHFMNEVERCDRIALMHAGKVLITGSPAELKRKHNNQSLETSFIAELEHANDQLPTKVPDDAIAGSSSTQFHSVRKKPSAMLSAIHRIMAQQHRETTEFLRDKIRLSFAFLGPLILLITLGYGINFDVDKLAFSVLDHDRSAQSRQLIEAFESSRYFEQRSVTLTSNQLFEQLRAGIIQFAIEIPPRFGRDLIDHRQPDILFLQNGTQPFKAQTGRGYIRSTMFEYMRDWVASGPNKAPPVIPYQFEPRFRFNQAYRSVVAIVPGAIMFILALVPAMLSALTVIREKETGAIYNLYVTKISISEYVIGKWITYVSLSFISYLLLLLLAVTLFNLTVNGSIFALLLGGFLFVMASTSFGILISSFVHSQMAALLVTTIIAVVPSLQFSGFLYPTSTLTGAGYWIGHLFPSLWFQDIMIACFVKSREMRDIVVNLIVLADFSLFYISAACLLIKKQEK